MQNLDLTLVLIAISFLFLLSTGALFEQGTPAASDDADQSSLDEPQNEAAREARV